MAAHFAWGPRTESGTEIWTLASWEPRVTSAEEPEWCGGVMTGSFSKSTGGGGDRLGSIEPHLCFCPSNTPISTIFTGQCWPFFSLLWNSLKNYIPRKHTLSPHISEVNVLKCKGGRKTIGTTGNRREFLKKKLSPPISQHKIYCNSKKCGEFQMSIIQVQATQLPRNYDLTSGGTIGERICMNLLSLVCIFAMIV